MNLEFPSRKEVVSDYMSRHHRPVVVLGVQHIRKAQLLQIAETHGQASFLTSLRKDGEQNGCQNRDNSDYNQ